MADLWGGGGGVSPSRSSEKKEKEGRKEGMNGGKEKERRLYLVNFHEGIGWNCILGALKFQQFSKGSSSDPSSTALEMSGPASVIKNKKNSWQNGCSMIYHVDIFILNLTSPTLILEKVIFIIFMDPKNSAFFHVGNSK